MAISRRRFLAGSAAAVVASTTHVPRLWAAANRQAIGNQDRILVVVQLSGGNDGLNTVVPYADDVYHRNRYATRIAREQVRKLNDYLGFHPALAGFEELSRAQRLTVVPGVGYANPNRSHFESMDIWHSAQFAPPYRTGWLGRWIDSQLAVAANTSSSDNSPDRVAAKALQAMHLGDEPLPLALTGLNALVPSLRSIESLRVMPDDLVQAALQSDPTAEARPDTKNELLGFLQEARSTALTAAEQLRRIDPRELRQTGLYDGSNLARKLASVAQLIKIGFGPRVYYIELAGFDTHSQQVEAHAALLGELGRALQAFHQDLSDHGQGERVLSFCFSEFGRRVKENGSRGTDHGTAGPVFLAGPENMKPLLGTYPSLSDLEDGDLKYNLDFRRIYATLLEKWLNVPSQPILGEPHPLLELWS